ncbi:MAG: hypothetical protein KBS70_01030 [Bacteroidales bacterium]|nr:hypothetical protein [Candidatus Colicola equi]
MRFKSIYLREAFEERHIEWSVNNLIHSDNNSKGKTTLLRLLLYSIGYNIPNTHDIKFEKCIVESVIETDSYEEISFKRNARNHIFVTKNNESQTYILPSQECELHQFIFGISNTDVLDNLLGTFYFDQEHGWQSMNKGIVIGGVRFNTEELIRGIADIDCRKEKQQREKLSHEISRLQQMLSISQYQAQIDTETMNMSGTSFNTQIESQIVQQQMSLNILKAELIRIDKALQANKNIRKYIEDLKLIVKLSDGQEVPVTKDNIVGMEDTINYLEVKRKNIAGKYNNISKIIENKAKLIHREDLQQSFFDNVESIQDIFDQKISQIPINAVYVQRKIEQLKKERDTINERIRALTYFDRGAKISDSIFKTINYILEKLGDEPLSSLDNIFVTNKKELSGAILHKRVFAYRLACLLEVEKKYNINLPIILDSPRGKEIDNENISNMMLLLNKEFKKNQIIVASIYDYNLDNLHRVEIKNHLIEQTE